MSAQNQSNEPHTPEKLGTIATVSGAVAAAFAAAACCVGPLVVAVLGVGGAGAMVALAPYRPYFMVATVLMLGAGFFMVYRRRPAATVGDDCGCDDEAPTQKRDLAKIMLWGATALVLAFSASPYLIGATASASDQADSSALGPARAGLIRVEIPVVGMDCASCGVAIQRAMDNVGVDYQDFELDLERQRISFRYAPALEEERGDAAVAERFAGSIRDIGYEVGEPSS